MANGFVQRNGQRTTLGQVGPLAVSGALTQQQRMQLQRFQQYQQQQMTQQQAQAVQMSGGLTPAMLGGVPNPAAEYTAIPGFFAYIPPWDERTGTVTPFGVAAGPDGSGSAMSPSGALLGTGSGIDGRFLRQASRSQRCQCKVQVLVKWGGVGLSEAAQELGIPSDALIKQAKNANAKRGQYESKISEHHTQSQHAYGRSGHAYQGFPIHPSAGKAFDELSTDEKKSLGISSGPHPDSDEQAKGIDYDPPRFCFYFIVRYSCNCKLTLWQLKRTTKRKAGEAPVADYPSETDWGGVLDSITGKSQSMPFDGDAYSDDFTMEIRKDLLTHGQYAGGACVYMWMDCPTQPESGSDLWEWLVVARADSTDCVPAYSAARVSYHAGDKEPRVTAQKELN